SFDIQRLCDYLLAHAPDISPIEIDEEIVQQFIYAVSKQVKPRSQARIISGLKSFFAFLIFEDYRSTNPMELIEKTRLGRKLPEIFSIQIIDVLFSAIHFPPDEVERIRA